MRLHLNASLAIGMLLLAACTPSSEKASNQHDPESISTQTRFQLLSESESGIAFSNVLSENDSINVVRYDYLYNGGGVAVADFNQDGWPDLYFTGNMVDDALYLNQGDGSFKEVSQEWGILNYPGWSSGAVPVDINADGFPDLYVCRTGPYADASTRRNRLFINQEGRGFTEQAAEYGLDYAGHSTTAAFFDADADGDLDCYLLTHPDKFRNRINTRELKQLIDAGLLESDRFYRNENGYFRDDSEAAGIFDFAFGLGLVIEDFNGDGHPDIYVSNDFDEGDAMYINDGKGRFTNEVTRRLKHTSNYGMGCDAADINNNGWIDLIQVDMAFETHERSKRNMASMDIDRFEARLKLGWHYQYMNNTLQLNNGDGSFSEIAHLAGVHKTDWSWAALFADFDNDGLNDLLITNGYKRDTKDNDIVGDVQELVRQKGQPSIDEVLGLIPSTKLKNYLFRNKDGTRFERANEEWGITEASNSQGAVYVDLDRDGDLDVVINNLDEPAAIYLNRSVEMNPAESNWVAFLLPKGCEIGTRIQVFNKGQQQQRYAQTTRGYLGGFEPVLHFGLGRADVVDSVRIWWPNGSTDVLTKVETNHYHPLLQSESATKGSYRSKAESRFFDDLSDKKDLVFKHLENPFNDFAEEVLLPHKMSEHGPGIAAADLNGDGLEDVWVGGGAGQAGAVFFQTADGSFARSKQEALAVHGGQEDVAGLFFDANGDGAPDLYVVSGDAGGGPNSELLRDRLYLNNGAGLLLDASHLLPDIRQAGALACAGDLNGDGLPDLFVGGRHVPGAYPTAPESVVLLNTGQGFTRANQRFFGDDRFAPGMITDATLHDLDEDGNLDLLFVGEWMSPSVCYFKNERFEAPEPLLDQQEGWWFSIKVADLDGDGKSEIIAGNLGRNNKFKPTADKPLHCYAHDFDGNGSLDIVLAKYEKDHLYPVRGRECSSQQMPFIVQKFQTYRAYARAELEEIYGEEAMRAAYRLDAYTFDSKIFRQDVNGSWEAESLPIEAQFAPVRTLLVDDLNGDGRKDILVAGNFFGAEVETVRYDAGNGAILLNKGSAWKPLLAWESGLSLPHDVRQSVWVKTRDGKHLLVTAVNQSYVRVHQLKE